MTEHDGMTHTEFRVVETADLPDDETTAQGTVEVADGERATVLRFRTPADRLKLHGFGMNDELDCEYQIHVDGELSSSTESPLGTLDSPFSFEDVYGRAVSMTEGFELKVINNSGGTVEFAARAFLREVEVPSDPSPAPSGLDRYGGDD